MMAHCKSLRHITHHCEELDNEAIFLCMKDLPY